ncbi:hypothetical protein [Nocardioides sp. 616]|uniref:hypothetical protein n=1 Tax=Nocardioides sp. 616 TaxID=2268090 RepID=UPI0013B38FA5|nr:hypothetical protein [Nocardioides sp. 616]
MTRRTAAAALSALALGAGLLTGASATASASAEAAPAKCLSESISPKKAIRAKSGAKLGTAQVFRAAAGDEVGFCVRVQPVPRLRKKMTSVTLKDETFFPDGSRSSSGMKGGSWRNRMMTTGSDFGPGFSYRGVVRLKAPGGPVGTVTVTAVL